MKKLHYIVAIVLLLFIIGCNDLFTNVNVIENDDTVDSRSKEITIIGSHIIHEKSIEIIKDDLVIEGQSVKDALLSHDPAGEWKTSITKDEVTFIFIPRKDIPADSIGFPKKDLVAGTEYPIVISHAETESGISISDSDILGDTFINAGGSGSGSGTGGSGSGTGGSGSGSGGSGSGTGGSGNKIVYVATPQTKSELKALIAERIKRDGNKANLNDIDVRNITHMGSLFYGSSFNGDISQWDVSSVTNMSYMFSHALQFNGDISQWDVSSVTNMSDMFKTASSFNQDISGWDVGNVIDMYSMFRETAFNQDISGWDVSNVTNVGYIFYWAKKMTYNLEAWGSKLPVGVQKHNTWKYSILEGSGNVPSWA